MYTKTTYQDWAETVDKEKPNLVFKIISDYQGSTEFRTANDAELYFVGSNPAIMGRKKLQVNGVQEVEDSTGAKHNVAANGEVQTARVPSNFFFRFVTQQNQYLLSNGAKINEDKDAEIKAKLGSGFDTVLQQIGEKALIHGACYGFYNRDHVEFITAAGGMDTGAVALLDEETSEIKVLIQFWRIHADKPMYARVFELDGVATYKRDEGGITVHRPKQAYITRVTRDGIGEMTEAVPSYKALPIIPMYANNYKRSELTDSLKSKMDAYDVILSDFADNLERTNDVYWAINNFGGTADDVIAMLAEINRIKATYVESGDNGGSTATPHTIEVPYQARAMALDLLEKAMYKDYMALNMQELTGGSLTNVAIKAAMTNLDLKADRYEWQAFGFVQQLLALIEVETESIAFKRHKIVNDAETIQSVYQMRSDITRKKALEINPYIEPDEIPQLLVDVAAEEIGAVTPIDELMTQQGV